MGDNTCDDMLPLSEYVIGESESSCVAVLVAEAALTADVGR